MLWGKTQPGYEAKVDVLLHSHNRIHVVRALVNIVRTRGPEKLPVCLWREALRVVVHFDMNHSHKILCT